MLQSSQNFCKHALVLCGRAMNSHHILVVGGAGYIGSHIAYLLHTQGYTVTLLDNLRYGQSPQAVRKWGTLVVGDYGDRVVLDTIFSHYSIAAVVHCAALLEVGESVRDPGPFYATNVSKTQVLLDAMRSAGVRNIIYSSSCAVYGMPRCIPITEELPFAPISPYGRTKVAVEYLLHDYARAYDMSYVSLRYFNAAGAQPEVGIGEQHDPETHLIPLVLRAIHTGQPFSVFGTDYDTHDGSAVRDYVHVRDIAIAHLYALEHLSENDVSDCFNLGTGHGYSVKEVIAAAEQVMQKKAQIVHAPRRVGDPAVLIADASKAERLLQWRAEHSSLPFIMQAAARWFLEQQQVS